jgi:hypothetical protein
LLLVDNKVAIFTSLNAGRNRKVVPQGVDFALLCLLLLYLLLLLLEAGKTVLPSSGFLSPGVGGLFDHLLLRELINAVKQRFGRLVDITCG